MKSFSWNHSDEIAQVKIGRIATIWFKFSSAFRKSRVNNFSGVENNSLVQVETVHFKRVPVHRLPVWKAPKSGTGRERCTAFSDFEMLCFRVNNMLKSIFNRLRRPHIALVALQRRAEIYESRSGRRSIAGWRANELGKRWALLALPNRSAASIKTNYNRPKP